MFDINIFDIFPEPIVASLIASLVAILGFRLTRRSSREKNSIDFETHYKTNESIVDSWKTVSPIIRKGKLNYNNVLVKPDNKTLSSINIISNTWERAANGIFHDIYDGHFLYKTYGSTVIITYESLFEYIRDRQKTNPRFYLQFTRLYLSWLYRRNQEEGIDIHFMLPSLINRLNGKKHSESGLKNILNDLGSAKAFYFKTLASHERIRWPH